jgi:hypothetical protein
MRTLRTVERRRRGRYGTTAKAVTTVILTSLLAMLCYAVWRIGDIEEPSKMVEYEYRMIGNDEINSTDHKTTET